MLYHSTRGAAPSLDFSGALLAGLARDGGLYVPAHLPRLRHDTIADFAGQSYQNVAHTVMSPFLAGDALLGMLPDLIAQAYHPFRHVAVAPVVELERNVFLAELFHGPTLAFKDLAMQLLGAMMNALLQAKGRRATVLGATSGDTGAAAVAAFAGQEALDVFILFPKGRISEVQRRQMTTAHAGNVHCLAVEGTFDDCQALVKTAFQDLPFRDGVQLTGINSINFARICAQMVYYFTAAVSLGAPHRPVSFAVPTGNFGNVLAGYYAKMMGLPIDTLVIAANSNDILPRALESGVYAPKAVIPTQSPSMDIQVSSNFERLLFDVMGRDAAKLGAAMATLAQSHRLELANKAREAILHNFAACRASEEETAQTMASVYKNSGYVLDPHSAVGVFAARAYRKRAPDQPVIALGTAYPAKFPDAVERATGVRPPLPDFLAGLYQRNERIHMLENDAKALKDYVKATLARA